MRKADAVYPIVGAASITAKVTRDRCLEQWTYAERNFPPAELPGQKRKREEDDDEEDIYATGSGYPGDPRTVRYLHETLDPVFGWAGIVRFSWATAKTLLEEAVRSSGSRRADASATLTYTPMGTRLPTATRGYVVRWMDEPATLTDFFSRGAPRKIGAPRAMSTKATPEQPFTGPTAQVTPLQHRMQQLDCEVHAKQRPALWKDLALSSACASDIFG